MKRVEAVNIAIFASGAGSNAKKIIEHFHNHAKAKIAVVVSDKPDAGVLGIARDENLPIILLDKERFFKGDAHLPELLHYDIHFIVLAGFLWKVPVKLITAYPAKIINLHPALLPKYGGKGMYGKHVHEAVIQAGEKESGISIHYVDEVYDHGEIIFQQKCAVDENDTAETLANKIHSIEHANYPLVIEKVLSKWTDFS